MKYILSTILLITSVNAFSQMEKVGARSMWYKAAPIVDNNIDSLDRRISTLVDLGSVYETIHFDQVEYDTVNSTLGYIIFSADSIWCERPRGVFRRRLDE